LPLQKTADENGNASTDSHLYRVKTNGPYSMPPKFIGLRVPQNFVTPADSGIKKIVYTPADMFSLILVDIAGFPTDTPRNIIFELYFETALDAEINLFSLMDLFRVETTNSCISFTPKLMNKKILLSGDVPVDFDVVDFNSLYCAEISGTIQNTVNSGLFKFYIAPGLTDTKNNKTNTAMYINLIKPGI
jgi:hypothetical protein